MGRRFISLGEASIARKAPRKGSRKAFETEKRIGPLEEKKPLSAMLAHHVLLPSLVSREGIEEPEKLSEKTQQEVRG